MTGSAADLFINAAVWHGSLDQAETILAAHPEIAASDIHAAAILGDDAAVGRFLAANPANATAKGGPRQWDALTHLCFSKYLRLSPERSAAFVRAAEAIIDTGASPNTGFYEDNHRPEPAFESVFTGLQALLTTRTSPGFCCNAEPIQTMARLLIMFPKATTTPP